LSGLVRTCPHLSGLVRACPDLSGLVRTCPGLSGLVRTCPGLPGLARTCPDLSGLVRTPCARDDSQRSTRRAAHKKTRCARRFPRAGRLRTPCALVLRWVPFREEGFSLRRFAGVWVGETLARQCPRSHSQRSTRRGANKQQDTCGGFRELETSSRLALSCCAGCHFAAKASRGGRLRRFGLEKPPRGNVREVTASVARESHAEPRGGFHTLRTYGYTIVGRRFRRGLGKLRGDAPSPDGAAPPLLPAPGAPPREPAENPLAIPRVCGPQGRAGAEGGEWTWRSLVWHPTGVRQERAGCWQLLRTEAQGSATPVLSDFCWI
jgi:hypothetical protein